MQFVLVSLCVNLSLKWQMARVFMYLLLLSRYFNFKLRTEESRNEIFLRVLLRTKQNKSHTAQCMFSHITKVSSYISINALQYWVRLNIFVVWSKLAQPKMRLMMIHTQYLQNVIHQNCALRRKCTSWIPFLAKRAIPTLGGYCMIDVERHTCSSIGRCGWFDKGAEIKCQKFHYNNLYFIVVCQQKERKKWYSPVLTSISFIFSFKIYIHLHFKYN